MEPSLKFANFLVHNLRFLKGNLAAPQDNNILKQKLSIFSLASLALASPKFFDLESVKMFSFSLKICAILAVYFQFFSSRPQPWWGLHFIHELYILNSDAQ